MGDWNDFKNNVVEPFKKALDAFLTWLWNIITSVVSALLSPIAKAITSAIRGFCRTVGRALQEVLADYETGSASGIGTTFVDDLMFRPLFPLLLGIAVAVIAVNLLVLPHVSLSSLVVPFVVTLIIVILLTSLGTTEGGKQALDFGSNLVGSIVTGFIRWVVGMDKIKSNGEVPRGACPSGTRGSSPPSVAEGNEANCRAFGGALFLTDLIGLAVAGTAFGAYLWGGLKHLPWAKMIFEELILVVAGLLVAFALFDPVAAKKRVARSGATGLRGVRSGFFRFRHDFYD